MNFMVLTMDARVNGHAFSLLEVMLAVALAASLLVAAVLIRGRLIRQSRRASTIAGANVVAGRLVGQWEDGEIALDVGQELAGRDQTTGFRWALKCSQREIERGIFLKCLEVQVYANEGDNDATISFEAWQHL